MKYETICKDFQHRGLKNVNIKSEIISSQHSWVKKLYGGIFNEYNKIIPLTLLKNAFGEGFIFHSNVDFNFSLILYPEFYIKIVYSWKNTSAFLSLTPSCPRSQFLGFNKDMKINNKSFYCQDLLKESINFVEHLYKPFGVLKSWSEVKTEYNLEEKVFYK